jgi:hypothetical protein
MEHLRSRGGGACLSRACRGMPVSTSMTRIGSRLRKSTAKQAVAKRATRESRPFDTVDAPDALA